MQPAPPGKIRKYESADLDSLLSAWENATRLAHPFSSEYFLSAERKNIPNVYNPITDTWVAEYDSVVIGFMIFLPDLVPDPGALRPICYVGSLLPFGSFLGFFVFGFKDRRLMLDVLEAGKQAGDESEAGAWTGSRRFRIWTKNSGETDVRRQ